MPILPHIYCPVLTTLSAPMEADPGMFLRRHASTLVSMDLFATEELELMQGPQTANTLPFPSLHTLCGHISNRAAGRLLGMMNGHALVDVVLHLYYGVSSEDLLNFFEGASASLKSAILSYDSPMGGDGFDPSYSAHPSSPRICFPRLEEFTSECRMGDTVISTIRDAPRLVSLQVYGLPLNSEFDDQVSHILMMKPTVHDTHLGVIDRVGWRISRISQPHFFPAACISCLL